MRRVEQRLNLPPLKAQLSPHANLTAAPRRRRHDLALPHHAPPAHERPDRPAGHRLAVVGRPAAARGDPGVADRLGALQVDDREVGVVADRDPALADDAEQPRRAGAGQVDEARQGQPPRRDMVEHDGHERLHAGHARGALGIGLGLLGERVRRVVGAEHVDDPLRDAAPDAVAMLGPAHRRVHLQSWFRAAGSRRRSSVR